MRLLALTLSISFASAACAADVSVTVDTLARKNLADSVSKLADKEVECRKNAVELPSDKIKAVGLSKDQLKDAIAFHYLNSFTACSYPEASNVVVNLQVLNALQSEASESAGSATQLIVGDLSKLLKLKVDYLSIPESKRNQLEAIPNINKPFDMIKTAESLGL